MPAKIGRMILNDFVKEDSKFSPFNEDSYLSRDFYNSNKQYQKMNFGSFMDNAKRIAEIAKQQMPAHERKATGQKERVIREPLREMTTQEVKAGETARLLKEPPLQQSESTSSPKQTGSNRIPSIRDTIVAPYPNDEMAIVLFELDGDIQGDAFELQFANDGTQIAVFSRVPKELKSAEVLLGGMRDRKQGQNADCMLLDQVIKERLKGGREDNAGNLWELREVVNLPFKCKLRLYNKYKDEMDTYLLRKNDKGYAWGYFWVVAENVALEERAPTKVRCKTSNIETSDEESESDSSCVNPDTSHDDSDVMSVENLPVTKDQERFEFKTSEILELNREIDDLKQQQLLQKNSEQHMQAEIGAKSNEILHLQELQKNSDLRISELLLQNNTLKEASVNNEKHYESMLWKNRQDIERLTAQNATHHEELETYQKMLREKDKEVDALIVEKQRMDAELKRLQDLHEDKVQKYTEKVCEEKTELQVRILSLVAENAKLKTTLDGNKHHARQLEYYQDTVREKDEKIDALNVEKQRMVNELQSRDQRLQDLQSVISWKDQEYQNMLQNLRSEVDMLESEKREYEKIQAELVESHNAKVEDLENQLFVKQQTIDRQSIQVTKKNQLVHELRQKLEHKEDHVSEHPQADVDKNGEDTSTVVAPQQSNVEGNDNSNVEGNDESVGVATRACFSPGETWRIKSKKKNPKCSRLRIKRQKKTSNQDRRKAPLQEWKDAIDSQMLKCGAEREFRNLAKEREQDTKDRCGLGNDDNIIQNGLQSEKAIQRETGNLGEESCDRLDGDHTDADQKKSLQNEAATTLNRTGENGKILRDSDLISEANVLTTNRKRKLEAEGTCEMNQRLRKSRRLEEKRLLKLKTKVD